MKIRIFKWLKRQKKGVILALIAVSLSVAIACQHEKSNNIGTSIDEPSNTEGVFKMSYDMETMSFTKLDNPSLKPTAFEDVSAMPKVKKSAIKMTVFDDGTSDWTIKDMAPANPTIYADQTPPNKNPQIALTRIDRSGLVHFFDKNNTELSKYQMTVASLSDFVAMLKSDTSAANKSMVGNSLLSVRNGVNIRQILENAARNGATIRSVSPNVVSITSSVAMPNGNVQTRGDQKIVETVVDTAQRIMLASSIKDDQGQLIGNVFMKYNTGTPNPTLELMEQRTYDVNSPANRRTINITSTLFSNMQVTVH